MASITCRKLPMVFASDCISGEIGVAQEVRLVSVEVVESRLDFDEVEELAEGLEDFGVVLLLFDAVDVPVLSLRDGGVVLSAAACALDDDEPCSVFCLLSLPPMIFMCRSGYVVWGEAMRIDLRSLRLIYAGF